MTLEGVYVVRYFLGGSGCCVAESKEFQVHLNPITHKKRACLKIGEGQS